MSISVLFLVVLNLRNLNLRSVHMNLTPAMHTKTKVGLDFEFPHQVTILIRTEPIFYIQAVSCCEHPILVDESSATGRRIFTYFDEECQLDSLSMTEQFLTVNHC